MRTPLKSAFLWSFLLLVELAPSAHAQSRASNLRFEVTFPAERSRAPLDGRLLVFVSTDTSSEPRFQISDAPGTQQVFGVDVEGWKPGGIRCGRSRTSRAVRTVCRR